VSGMPIEIRELVIRATVGAGEAGSCGPSSSGSAQSSSGAHTRSDDDVVQTCVREVLRILEDKRER
jgi:Family of unknown function (DUF5908)